MQPTKSGNNTFLNLLIWIAVLLILATVFIAWKYGGEDAMMHNDMMMEGDHMMNEGDMNKGDMMDMHGQMNVEKALSGIDADLDASLQSNTEADLKTVDKEF